MREEKGGLNYEDSFACSFAIQEVLDSAQLALVVLDVCIALKPLRVGSVFWAAGSLGQRRGLVSPMAWQQSQCPNGRGAAQLARGLQIP